MNVDGRRNSFLGVCVDVDEILAKFNIQQYYSEQNGFDFKAFVQIALSFDEREAESIMINFLNKECAKKQVNIEDVSFEFSEEELNLIYFDVMNLKTA